MEFDMVTVVLGVLSIIVALLGLLLVVLGGAFKYVHNRIIKDIDDMKDDMADQKKMLNKRIDTVKDDLKKYVEKTDTRLGSIDVNIGEILTILKKDA